MRPAASQKLTVHCDGLRQVRIGISDLQRRFRVQGDECLSGEVEPVAYRCPGYVIVFVVTECIDVRRYQWVVPADMEHSGLQAQATVQQVVLAADLVAP